MKLITSAVTQSSCVRLELLLQQTLCNVSLLLAAGIWREEKGGGGHKGPFVSLLEQREPNPQPPARRRGRAAVPHHTGALVPASERRVTGWHVSWGDAFMFLCLWEELLTKRRNIRLFARPLIGSIQFIRTLMWWIVNIQLGDHPELGKQTHVSSGWIGCIFVNLACIVWQHD